LQRKALRRTSLGRLPLGEKGVGRFAVHKLGDKIQLVTRAAGVDLHSNLRLGPMRVESGNENETGASFSLDLGAKFFGALSGESSLTI